MQNVAQAFIQDHFCSPGFQRREANTGQSAHNGKIPIARIENVSATDHAASANTTMSPARIRAEKNK
ncbi:hypothetical protein A2477_04695 [Candidatus Falkowbacteria bacterium RIFOXYC2_FULL_47_12]|uniref:Uncharacterized protein n=1 Tax=Candidatus Falkowbacteria bacterium RIFOXYC2_FULL_47_12 TaxID=1798004 RepID=A0A1F5TLU3_9BACT|nr:MAG: hypothetical protein A2477_04695 [Candidatus Falkowbacteria bacterium RIFOXYC2_FULL_47_12]